MRIFVSIASYRDPQLIPTIVDCLSKARRPEALRFGVCRQFGPEDPPFPFAGDPRFRVIDVDWRESQGACWARHEIMQRYDGEELFLQLDSHHRFVPDWDALAIEQLSMAGGDRPLLTTYAPHFRPDTPEGYDSTPTQMDFDHFTEEHIVLFRPSELRKHRRRTRPVQARFLSAHFLFTRGRFVEDVPYDPELYFIGEEITLAVRAFTHGYDLYHPHRVIVWHEYTRSYRPHKHWTDHQLENGVPRPWHDRDRASLEKVKGLLLEPRVGKYALGSRRTLQDYEDYAGLSFKHRKVQDYTRSRKAPPNPAMASDWADRVHRYRVVISFRRDQIPKTIQDYAFWYVGLHDEFGRELHREDLTGEEVFDMLAKSEPTMTVVRELESGHAPASWTIWPYSASAGWLEKFVGSPALEELA
jgi:hypothetical protein